MDVSDDINVEELVKFGGERLRVATEGGERIELGFGGNEAGVGDDVVEGAGGYGRDGPDGVLRRTLVYTTGVAMTSAV